MPIGQIITSGINADRAKKLRKRGEKLQREAEERRTDFSIPDEIRKNQQLAESDAFGKPALQSYLEEAAAREESSNLSAVNRYATSSADALAAAAGVNNQSARARTQAAASGEQVRQQNKGALYNANNQMADYETMAWDMNVNIPYLQRMQMAQQMQGAGYQGQTDSLNSIGRGFDNLLSFAGRMALPGASPMMGGQQQPYYGPHRYLMGNEGLAPMGPKNEWT